MFVVTNRITVKKDMQNKWRLILLKEDLLNLLKGFEGIEVWQIDKDDYSEDMYVNSWWETEEDFKNWVNSDVFKQAHKNTGKSEDSPVIKSEIVKSNVLSSLNRR